MAESPKAASEEAGTAEDNENQSKKPKMMSEFSVDLLQMYYNLLFPYTEMFRWLSYGNDPKSQSPWVQKDFFPRREFSFTLADDVYVRYRSFTGKEDFKKALQKHCPHKIDIGAIYNAPASMHASIPRFKPMEKEMVIDIDITDYDDIRVCCQGADICPRCWPLMTAAVEVVDTALREDFGFHHLLWVYSGRRGIHCWVCDKRARHMSNEVRGSVINFLSLYFGNKSQGLGLAPPLHPSLQRAFDILEEFFIDIQIRNQGLLDNPERWKAVLEALPEEVIGEVVRKWGDAEDGERRWEILKAEVNKVARRAKKPHLRKQITGCLYELVFTRVYPRLDINVSKQMHHLLKSPFCVHPKTGRVCVPIDPRRAAEFDPLTVPTLVQLDRDLNRTTAAAVSEASEGESESEGPHRKRKGWRHTSLKPYIEFFSRQFLAPLERSVMEEHRSKNAQAMTF